MSKSRKILYVLPNAELGGAEKFSFEIISRHDRSRYEPVLLFLNSGSLVAKARELGVRQHTLSNRLRLSNPLGVIRAIRECAELVTREEIDLVHSCMAYAHLIGGVAARLHHIPSLLFQHGPVGGILDIGASLVPVQQVITNSHYTASHQNKLSLIARPTFVLHYGIETPRADSGRANEVSEKYNLPANSTVLAIVARLDPWKGIHIAIEACAPVLRANSSHRLLVIGGPFRHFHSTYLQELKDLAATLGIESSVVFTGFQQDVAPFLARADILIHASTQPEPFGIAILEGMAAGKAVIASRAGGVVEIITDGEDGLLHTPGDISDLSKKIETLVDNPVLREKLGAKARRTTIDKFSPAAMMSSVEGLYDSILGNLPSRRGLLSHCSLLLLLLWNAPSFSATIWFDHALSSLLTIGDIPDPRVSSVVTRALSRKVRWVPPALWTELSDSLSPQPSRETAILLGEFLDLADPETEPSPVSTFPEISSIASAIGGSAQRAEEIQEEAEMILRAIAPVLRKSKTVYVNDTFPKLTKLAFPYLKALEYVAYGVLYEDGSVFLDWAVAKAIHFGNELNEGISSKMAPHAYAKRLTSYYNNPVHKRIRLWLTQLQSRIVDLKAAKQWPK